MYDLYSYGVMISDRVRTGSYAKALEAAVQPGSVVLDIGTGPGILALLACKFGARKVYAVEPDDVIEVGRDLARKNGFADRIEFIQDFSTRIELPEPADVLVADIHGVMPLFGESVSSILDARRRLLAPGAAMIPRREDLYAAPVQTQEVYEPYVKPWEDGEYGLDLTLARRPVANRFGKGNHIGEEHLLAPPACWDSLDYRTREHQNVSGEVGWTLEREGTVHGFTVWFDAELGDGIHICTGPGHPQTVYGRVFFAVAEPLSVQPGMHLSVRLRADRVGADYVWSWETTLREDGKEKAHFRQSTFYGTPLSLKQLRKRAASHKLTLNEDGQMTRFVFDLSAEGLTVGEAAQRLFERFGNRFRTEAEALSYVCDFSEKFT